jgi:hypothetical protein
MPAESESRREEIRTQNAAACPVVEALSELDAWARR